MEKNKVSARFEFVDLLKFIAIIMIVNSHAKWMYPESLQMLGIGGAWGCSLFFFVSGFTMANMKTEGFVNYAIKKAKRIYPAVWLWLGLSFLITNKIDWVQFIWPSAYWFLCSILVYYALFYFVIKYAKNNIKYIILVGIFATVLCYAYVDHSAWMIDLCYNPVTRIWYFVIMLLGAVCRNVEISRLGGGNIRCQGLILYTSLIGSFIGCYGIKFVCQRIDSLNNLQLLFPIVVGVACCLIGTLCRGWSIRSHFCKKIVQYIASITLEIYIVQQVLVFERYAEPLTPLGAIAATLLCASVIHYIVSIALSKIRI